MRWIDYFDRGWELNPGGPCIVDDEDGSIHSYTDIRDLTLRLANALHTEGFRPGAHGAVLSLNHPLAVAATLSIMRAGLVWVPLNPRNAESENGWILDAFDCDILFYHSDFAEAAERFREQAPNIKRFVCLDRMDIDNPSLEEFVRDHRTDFPGFDYQATDTVMMAGTGGTTGRPKGVMQSHRATELQVLTIMATMPFERRPVYMAVAPLTHATGYITYPIFAQGGTIVVQRQPVPKNILAAIPRHKVSCLFLPPTVIYALLAEPDVRKHDYSSLEYFIYGASPISAARLAEAIEVFGPMMQMFGQTETLFPLTYLPPEEHFVDGKIAPAERLTSCGRAAPGVEIAVMAEDGALLPQGEIGELVIRSGMVMKGYYKNAEATAEANAHGWYHTGDMGYRDPEGYFTIVDRTKDMIITGGFNVYSTEVEGALLAHEAVQECAVIGVPDEKWGEAIKAVVETRDGAKVTEEELIAFAKARIGSVKAPKSVDFVDSIPRSAVGKVLKRELRDKYWEGRGRRVG